MGKGSGCHSPGVLAHLTKILLGNGVTVTHIEADIGVRALKGGSEEGKDLGLARRHSLIHLFCSLERLRQWRHIPLPSFSISNCWVNLVQHPSSLPCDVLRSILLRFPLVHQPAIIGGSRQPATGRMSQLSPS